MRCGYLAGLAVVGLLSSSCTPDFATQDETQVLLRITSVLGSPGGEEQTAGTTLFSDVCCAIINDNAVLTFQAIPKNQNMQQPNVITGFGIDDVTLERYEVVYFRTDGRNTEGVDVPYRVTGPMSALIPANGASVDVAIVAVRHQAKLEPPLRNLHGVFLQGPPQPNGGGVFEISGAGIVTTIAEITVHGRTTSGKAIQAQTRLEIVFADFAGEG